MPTRQSQQYDYRYGFQGQEKDDELKGSGNSWNYKYRMHDARVGRFFSVDPLTPEYPWFSPYQFSGNKLIASIELEGLENLDLNQVNRGMSSDNGLSLFYGGEASKTFGGIRSGFNYNFSTSYTPGSSAFFGNVSSSLTGYGRKNNVWAGGIGSSTLISFGYRHNRNTSSFQYRRSGSGKLTPNNGFSVALTIEGHFDIGVLHPISTVTKGLNFNFPTGDHSAIQFAIGNDFGWGGALNFGYNGHTRKFSEAQDGGITMHGVLGHWWDDYGMGLVFQAWGTTAHRIPDANGHRGYAVSSETRDGRNLYLTENTRGSYFGTGQLTLYTNKWFNRKPLIGNLGVTIGVEGQRLGGILQDAIHFTKPFSKPGNESLLFDWDMGDKARLTFGISYSRTISRTRRRYGDRYRF